MFIRLSTSYIYGIYVKTGNLNAAWTEWTLMRKHPPGTEHHAATTLDFYAESSSVDSKWSFLLYKQRKKKGIYAQVQIWARSLLRQSDDLRLVEVEVSYVLEYLRKKQDGQQRSAQYIGPYGPVYCTQNTLQISSRRRITFLISIYLTMSRLLKLGWTSRSVSNLTLSSGK